MSKFKRIVAGIIVFFLYRAISLTWKVKIHEPEELKKDLAQNKSVIFGHFHGDELVLISLVKKYKISTMTSTSKDGEIMNTALKLLGAKTSRGSSTRGGISALKGLIRLSKEGYNSSFAVDGPRGPLFKVKPGIFEFSRLTNSNIYPGGVYCDRAWHFPKSWNKTFFPKPFARINIYWARPFPAVNKDLDPRSPDLAIALENQLFDARRNAANFIAASHSET